MANTQQVNFQEQIYLPPVAENNSNDIFRVNSPGGASAFSGTINGTPSGLIVSYNVVTGNEGVMKPASASHLAKMRLYNTTRGNSALISDVDTILNNITLTATVPANWAATDTITVASQTVSGGGFSWVDLEITSSALLGKSSIFVNVQINSGAASDALRIHPFDASLSSSKYLAIDAQVAGVTQNGFGLIRLVNNVFSVAWTANSTALVIREAGYIQ